MTLTTTQQKALSRLHHAHKRLTRKGVAEECATHEVHDTYRRRNLNVRTGDALVARGLARRVLGPAMYQGSGAWFVITAAGVQEGA